MSVNAIIAKIPNSFEKAKETGDLLFFPSNVITHHSPDASMEFQIRVCPALQKKPQLPASQPESDRTADAGLALQAESGKAFDPFAPPYNTHLYVGELKDESSEEEYVVLLNRFSVVPHHFLLVSKEFKPQTSPLLPPDLLQAYKILMAGRKIGRYFLAFYNCGDNSGASQPHKHIQIIPWEGDEPGPPIERLARRIQLETPSKPFTISQLPYANHSFRLPPDIQTESDENLERTLANAFISLLDLGISTIRHAPDYPTGKPSYNIIITLEHLHLIPRRYDTYTLSESGQKVSVNSLGFAGMLLVKSEEELKWVKKEGIGKILRGVALESVHDLQVAGTTDEALNLITPHM